MANTFYAKQTHAHLITFMPEMARFLVDDLVGFTGPGWTVIDTYSSGAASPHEVPADPADLDSLASDNGWRSGSLVAGDYIVLESASVSNPFQVMLQYYAATYITYTCAPMGGWVTGNDSSDPMNAGNWGSPVYAMAYLNNTDVTANWSIVSNGDRFILLQDSDPIYNWAYIGKPLDTHTGDDYSAVMWNTPSYVYHYSLAAFTNKLSPVDDTTILACYLAELSGPALAGQGNLLKESSSSEFRLFPLYVLSNTASHLGTFGYLDGVYFTNANLGANPSKGTLDTKAYSWIKDNGSDATLVFDWDSTTAI